MHGIELDHLTVSVGDRTILSDISLSLPGGKPIALVGEAGSGKTSLLRALAGLWPSQATVSGTLVVEGRDVTRLDPAQRRSVRQGGVLYLPSSGRGALNPVETIERQISDIARFQRGWTGARRDVRPAAASLLRSLGIADPGRVLDSLPDELSGGMNKRVLLAIALLMDARVLALDEPTGGLDVTIQRQILDLIASIQKERGLTVILATQNLGIVAHYVEHVVVLDEGTVSEVCSPEQFFLNPISESGKRMLQRARSW